MRASYPSVQSTVANLRETLEVEGENLCLRLSSDLYMLTTAHMSMITLTNACVCTHMQTYSQKRVGERKRERTSNEMMLVQPIGG